MQITVYENTGEHMCAAFLTNNHTTQPSNITFRGANYYLPEKSVSILADCKTVVYNTQTVNKSTLILIFFFPNCYMYCITGINESKQVVSQHNSRNFVPSEKAKNLKWEMYQEKVPTVNELALKNREPLELYSLTKDKSDYAWYSTRYTII